MVWAERHAGRETPQGTAFTTPTRSYGNQCEIERAVERVRRHHHHRRHGHQVMRAVLARGEESLLPRRAFPPSVDVRRHGRRADVREVAAAALRRRRVAARAGFENC